MYIVVKYTNIQYGSMYRCIDCCNVPLGCHYKTHVISVPGIWDVYNFHWFEILGYGMPVFPASRMASRDTG